MQKTSIVIPCYNEGSRLDLEKFHRYLEEQQAVDFCFVDDGSKDNTYELLEKFALKHFERVKLVRNSKNMGKAEAVRKGVLHSLSSDSYDFVGYFDADLSTPLCQIGLLREVLITDSRCIMALGSRFRHLGARIERNEMRHYLGRVFSTFASIILKLPVYDTQCGAKLVRAESAAALFKDHFTSRWLFDVELLARIITSEGYEATLREVVEVPLQIWIEKGDSRLNFKSVLRVPFELLKIQRRYFSGSSKV
ncbi:MAG: glycosyltransferase [Chitinispirillaceae bacterium]